MVYGTLHRIARQHRVGHDEHDLLATVHMRYGPSMSRYGYVEIVPMLTTVDQLQYWYHTGYCGVL